MSSAMCPQSEAVPLDVGLEHAVTSGGEEEVGRTPSTSRRLGLRGLTATLGLAAAALLALALLPRGPAILNSKGTQLRTLKAAECHIKDGETCPMSAMPQGSNEYVNIYPGGETACLNDTSPFFFNVWPGDSDKLAISFAPGGICFDKKTTTGHFPTGGMFTQGLCYQDPYSQGSMGVFNKSNTRNPLKRFTILNIVYCSGDAHVGNSTRTYCKDGKEGCRKYKARGYVNARTAIDWVKTQMDKKLTHLSVFGASAGAIGTYFWAGELLQEFSSDGWTYQDASVLVDSFASVTPKGTVAPMLKSFGICTTGILSKKMQRACLRGGDVEELNLRDALTEAMVAYPSVKFGLINSKTDGVQVMYYKAVALAYRKYWEAKLSKQNYYRKLNDVLEDFSKQPNFAAYLVKGSQHTFLGMEFTYDYYMLCNFYWVGTMGIKEGSSGGKQGTLPLLYEWVNSFANDDAPQTQCYGPPVARSEWESKDFKNTSYCDAALFSAN